MVSAVAFGINGFMVSSVGRQVLCGHSGSLVSYFLFLAFKIQKHKKRTGNRNTFLVTDHSDRYLASRPVYLNVIIYITMLITVNKLQ